MIGSETIFSALMLIALLLIIISVPAIILSSRNSFKHLRRYMSLRMLKGADDSEIPSHIIDEWNAVKSNVGYATLISEELEKISSLKPALFQADIAIVLIILLAIYPGFETDVLFIMIALLIVTVIAVIYGMLTIRMYSMEYVNLAREMAGKDGQIDNMYG